MKLAEPKYSNWAVRDKWKKPQAAFLLSGIDPEKYRSIRIGNIDVPPEFEQAREMYSLLSSVRWEDRYKDYYYGSDGMHPAAVISEMISKRIDIPCELREMVEVHYPREMECIRVLLEKNSNAPNSKVNKETTVGNREKRSWQSGFAIMTRLLAKKIGKINSDDEVTMSSSQILQMILDEAERIGFPIDGIKSFDRKISSSLKLLEDEKSN